MGVSKIIAYSRFPVSLSECGGRCFRSARIARRINRAEIDLDIKYILYFIVVKKILLSCQKHVNFRDALAIKKVLATGPCHLQAPLLHHIFP